MEVTYELSRTDISQLFRYIRHHRSQMRPVFQFGYLFIISLSVVGIVFSQNASNMPKNSAGDMLWAFGLVSLLLYQTYNFIIRPVVVEWQAQRDPQMVSRKTMQVSPVGVFVRDALGDVTLSWPTIEAVIDDRDCFYFFLEKNNAYAVPKRAFNGSTKAYAFFDAASAYWREAKGIEPLPAPDVSGVWPPAPRAGDSQEPGETPKH